MNNVSPLLDWAEQHARATDPATSEQAAKEIGTKVTVRCTQFLHGLEKLGRATANEVANQVAPDNPGLFGSIRRRASDLDRLGVIRVVDRRRCNVTGKMVSVYEVARQV